MSALVAEGGLLHTATATPFHAAGNAQLVARLERLPVTPCAFRKSYPDVMVVQLWLPKTQIRAYRWCSPPRTGCAIMSPNRSIGRLQGASALIIVAGVFRKNAPKMFFV